MSRCCQWIDGDPRSPDMTRCGRDVVDPVGRGSRRSYCAEHLARAIRQPGEPLMRSPAPKVAAPVALVPKLEAAAPKPKPARKALWRRGEPLVTFAAILEAEARTGITHAGRLAALLKVSPGTIRRLRREARGVPQRQQEQRAAA